jgi:3-isopropylmalate dehydrogenase
MKLAILAGDGIGPEVTTVSQNIITRLSQKFGFEVSMQNALIGHSAIEKT